MEVLVIEDDNMWQMRMQVILGKIGITNLKFANSTTQAIDIFHKCQPNLIIADILLEGNEIFTIYRLQKIAVTPTVFISSKATQKHLDKVKKLPNATLLEKPFGELSLAAAINAILPTTTVNSMLSNSNFNMLTAKPLFDVVKDTKLLELMNFNETDKKILGDKWFDLKSFTQIAAEIGISSERVRTKYDAAIRKLKTKMQHLAKTLDEYQEFKKIRYNNYKLKKIKKGEQEFLEIDKLNIHIDELIEIPTKYRNILKERDITRLGDLGNITFRQLAMTKHLGSGSAKMIEDAIAKFGIKLKE